MIEIRFHGRGGEGVVVASEILAKSASKEGKYVQSFPFFGVERRGAPVSAFVRIDEKEIWIKELIYQPDIVVVFDPVLLNTVNVFDGLKENGTILINCGKDIEIKKPREDIKVAVVDATKIALGMGLGTKALPIVNTAMLGALVKITELVKLESLVESIEETVKVKKQENIESAKEAYNSVEWKEVPIGFEFKESEFEEIKGEKNLPQIAISLKTTEENKTGKWRFIKPVIEKDKCRLCLLCWKFCPDISIKINKEEKSISFDYSKCKGCGICAEVCPAGAIKMVEERE